MGTKLRRKVKVTRRNPLLYPGAALQGRDLAAAAEAQTAAEYAPRQRALKAQAGQSSTQGGVVASRAGDYYRQLAEREQAGFARQAALAAMLKSDTAKVGTDTQAAFDKEAARAAAARTGPASGIQGADQTAKVDAELASLRGLASTRQQASQDSAASQGANYTGLSDAMSQARGLRGGEVQSQLLTALANEQMKLRDQGTALSNDRSATKMSNLLKLRQQGFENTATAQTLGIKQADINATLAIAGQRSRDAAAGRKVTRANALTSSGTSLANTQARINSSEKVAAANRALKRELAPTTGPNGTKLTAGQIAANQKFMGSALSVATDYSRLKDRGWKGPKLSAHFRKAGVPSIALNAAADIANFGFILPAHVKVLEQAGYTVPVSLRRRAGAGIPSSKK